MRASFTMKRVAASAVLRSVPVIVGCGLSRLARLNGAAEAMVDGPACHPERMRQLDDAITSAVARVADRDRPLFADAMRDRAVHRPEADQARDLHGMPAARGSTPAPWLRAA